MDSKTFNSLSEAYAAIYSETVDETYTVTAADKKGNTKAYQNYKAGMKKKDGTPMYKAADHMKEGVRDVDPEKGTAERKAKLEKKRGMKLDDHPQYKKEEVENVEELYKGKHGQSEKEYQDSRSDAGKMISGDSKTSGAAYSARGVKNTGPNPAGGSKKPQAQGRMGAKDREYLAYRKANLKKEELEASGLFTEEEINAILEADTQFDEGYKEIDAKKHGRMYDRYKKLRSAAIKDAQDSGEASGDNRMKMGKMSAAIDKSSENLRKKQTKDQLTGRG